MDPWPRRWLLSRFRRAHEAHRDARLVFKAAAEGRPLELQRRLVLGKLAGGLSIVGPLHCSYTDEDGRCIDAPESIVRDRVTMVSPLQAAVRNSHDACIAVLESAIQKALMRVGIR